MKALVIESKHATPRLMDVAEPATQADEVVVTLHAASLNHRDVWIQKGLYPGVRFPIIPGSDGAGTLDGRDVIIQPGINWGDNEKAQGGLYQILGLPNNGTFAERVLVRNEQVYGKPSHLSIEEAAALPLAGLTAYRVLFTRCKAVAGEKILVTGAGGGVALFCIQFALAAGLEVYVTSGADEKIDKTKAMGASGGANYKALDWVAVLKKQAGGFDVIIDGAGGEGFSELLKLANPGARIGVYGGSLGAVPNFSPQQVFWKQLSILGSTMGNDADFAEMLGFVERHKIVPVVDSVYEFAQAGDAFEWMENGQQFGKIVFRIG